MQFAAIQSHQSLKERLIDQVRQHRVPHAQLFWGPEGNASLPLVRAFITYLYCQHPLKEDACGKCSPCRQVQKLVHPDVTFVFPTSTPQQTTPKGKGSTYFMKTWRSFLHEHPYGQASDWSCYLNSEKKQLSIAREETRGIVQGASLKGFENSYKVILIWLPEYLHPAAANALLKVIEEPPSATLFLLVSHNPEKVMETIRSRVQQIHVPAFTDEALVKMLEQRYTLEQERLTQIVLLAEGNFNKALKLVEKAEEKHFTRLRSWMRLCYACDFTQLTDEAANFQALPSADQRSFLVYALHLLREALVLHFAQNALTRIPSLEQAFVKKLKQQLKHQQVKTWINWLNKACYCIERNANPRLLYLDLSLRIAHNFAR